MPELLSTYYPACSCSYYCGNLYLFAEKILGYVTPNDYFLVGATLSPKRCQKLIEYDIARRSKVIQNASIAA